MRTIAIAALTISVGNSPYYGGVEREYIIRGPDDWEQGRLRFQAGDPQEVGVNGVEEKTLLAILEDRLKLREANGGNVYALQQALISVRSAARWRDVHERKPAVSTGVPDAVLSA